MAPHAPHHYYLLWLAGTWRLPACRLAALPMGPAFPLVGHGWFHTHLAPHGSHHAKDSMGGHIAAGSGQTSDIGGTLGGPIYIGDTQVPTHTHSQHCCAPDNTYFGSLLQFPPPEPFMACPFCLLVHWLLPCLALPLPHPPQLPKAPLLLATPHFPFPQAMLRLHWHSLPPSSSWVAHSLAGLTVAFCSILHIHSFLCIGLPHTDTTPQCLWDRLCLCHLPSCHLGLCHLYSAIQPPPTYRLQTWSAGIWFILMSLQSLFW